MISFQMLKDPDSDLDYTLDCSLWLGEDMLSAQTWAVPVNSGIVVYNSVIDGAKKQVLFWMKGGTLPSASRWLRVVCHIETQAGRKEDITLLVQLVG